MAEVGQLLDPADFYSPAHGYIYASLVAVYAAGTVIDASTVAAHLSDAGLLEAAGGSRRLVELLTVAPPISTAVHHAARVVEMAHRRHVATLARNVGEALDGGASAMDAAAPFLDAADRVMVGGGEADDDVVPLEQWVRNGGEESPWIIPGVLRQEWRMMVTAPPGAGKATLIRQMCWAASRGVHPFTLRPIPPVRALIVDLENPVSAARQTVEQMAAMTSGQGRLGEEASTEEGACLIWSKVQGLNLRARRDRASLERRIRQAAPDLVALCPIYKTFAKDSRLSAEEVALEVCEVLDDLRTRLGFGLLMEHHSPRGSLQLLPFGSSQWERWPELGVTLNPDEDDPRRVVVGRFRRDRVPVHLPRALRWGSGWPFEAEW